MGLAIKVLAMSLLAAPMLALASTPITETDAMVCLSGAGVPAEVQAEDLTFKVDGKEELPVTETSHFMVLVDMEGQHQVQFKKDGELIQTLSVDFKDRPSKSACLRYDPVSRLWLITQKARQNVCLDCAPDWVE